MSYSLPGGRKGQLLALGLTLSILGVLARGLVMPLVDWHGERSEALEERAALARRMVDLAAALPGLRQQIAAAASRGPGRQSLLEGDTDSLASALLQDRLQGMFMRAGVQLNSVETLPGDETGSIRRINLRVSFDASWPVLMALLKEIQVAVPVLLLDDLQVEPAVRISAAPGTFGVSCTIFAFRSGQSRADLQ